jgi:plasmid maintenance system antidote protein VapI
MTGKQLQRMIDKTGRSQSGLAREIGITDRQMRRYIAGDRPVPTFIALAVTHVCQCQHGTEKAAG